MRDLLICCSISGAKLKPLHNKRNERCLKFQKGLRFLDGKRTPFVAPKKHKGGDIKALTAQQALKQSLSFRSLKYD